MKFLNTCHYYLNIHNMRFNNNYFFCAQSLWSLFSKVVVCVSNCSGWLQPNHSSFAPITPRPWKTICYISVLITKYLIVWQDIWLGNYLPGAVGNPNLPQSEIEWLFFVLWKCSSCLMDHEGLACQAADMHIFIRNQSVHLKIIAFCMY